MGEYPKEVKHFFRKMLSQVHDFYPHTQENRTIQIDEDNQRFHFALTGKTWAVIRQHCPDLLSKLVVRGAVFARMGPEQKAQLVELLQDVG